MNKYILQTNHHFIYNISIANSKQHWTIEILLALLQQCTYLWLWYLYLYGLGFSVLVLNLHLKIVLHYLLTFCTQWLSQEIVLNFLKDKKCIALIIYSNNVVLHKTNWVFLYKITLLYLVIETSYLQGTFLTV